jgi:hypothetical protein
MARRKKRSPTPPPATAESRANQLVLRDGNGARMDSPNNLVPVDISWRNQFPLLQIRARELPEDSRRSKMLFYGKQYGEPYSDYPAELVPPTWMDPMLFVAMARHTITVPDILNEALASNNVKHGRRKLTEALRLVFEQIYLPYVVRMFDEALPFIAEWLVCNCAYRAADETHRTKMAREYHKSRSKSELDEEPELAVN